MGRLSRGHVPALLGLGLGLRYLYAQASAPKGMTTRSRTWRSSTDPATNSETVPTRNASPHTAEMRRLMTPPRQHPEERYEPEIHVLQSLV